jgi:hypothetical protein
MRFDAYAGNVSGASAEEVSAMTSWAIKGRFDRHKPRGRYHDCFEVFDGTAPVGWVGHDPQLDTAYFEFKGPLTPQTSAAIRKHWPDSHNVSRVDSCEDWDDKTSFERVSTLIDQSVDPRVKSRIIAPRCGQDTGRTIYWGSPKSAVLVRLYEAGKMEDRTHFGTPDWVRAEVQLRPPKAELKKLMSRLTPLDAWGFSAWSTRAAARIAEVDVNRFVLDSAPPDFERTTLYLARAYKRHFAEMLADHGDWLCLGREIEAVWAADDEAKKAFDRQQNHDK